MRRWIAMVVLMCSCRGETPNSEQRLPQLQPPQQVSIPSKLHIEAINYQGAKLVIDAQKLKRQRPDFVDEERWAWRLDQLIATHGEPQETFAVTSASGTTVVFPTMATTKWVPVLLLNRRGDTIVQLIDGKQPFPRYHGGGNRMKRPPAETLPQVRDVQLIRVSTSHAR